MQNILITGTSKGIGKMLVDGLKNYNQVFGISRTKTNNTGFTEINIDLTNFESFNNINKILEQNNTQLEVLILNAGVGYFGKFEEGNDEKYKQIINLNLLSPILLVKNLEKYLSKNAKIIFVGSIVSKKFLKYGAVYQASKFGLRGFAGSLKNEMKDKKIFLINPKIVKTSFHDKSEIEIDFSDDKITSLENIFECVKNILNGKENRFEIDL